MTSMAQRVFGDPSRAHTDMDTYSIFTPYALYSAAVVQRQLWRQVGLGQYRESFERMRSILVLFSKRWRVADTYLRQLDIIPETSRVGYFLCKGAAISPRGPTGDPVQSYSA
jgi:hypothetical protein